ncbi:hypothetical protein [Streptomyces sp. NPDC059611]
MATQQHTRPEIQAAAVRRLREPGERFVDGHQALEELPAGVARTA